MPFFGFWTDQTKQNRPTHFAYFTFAARFGTANLSKQMPRSTWCKATFSKPPLFCLKKLLFVVSDQRLRSRFISSNRWSLLFVVFHANIAGKSCRNIFAEADVKELPSQSRLSWADFSEQFSHNISLTADFWKQLFKAACSEQMLQSGLFKADASKQKNQNLFHYQSGRLWFLKAYPIEKLAGSNCPLANFSDHMSQTRLFREDDPKQNSPRKDCRASYSTQICSSRFLNCNSSAPLSQKTETMLSRNKKKTIRIPIFEPEITLSRKYRTVLSRTDVPRQSLPPMFLKVNVTQRIHPLFFLFWKHSTVSILLKAACLLFFTQLLL